MKIANLTRKHDTYQCNVYLVRGTWNTLADINTLVDAGRDAAILDRIKSVRTGAGQKKIHQVVLTHSHYDHTTNLPLIKSVFNPVIRAFSPSLAQCDRPLYDGEILRFGDRDFEVIHTPGHSSDSVCFYCQSEGILFAGDNHLLITTPGDTYSRGFVRAMERICSRDVEAIYFGHGEPLLENCNARLRTAWRIVASEGDKEVIR